nr:alpha-L-fucosidase [Paenibacillus sacheonensis]
MADQFNAAGFAADAHRFGVDYVTITAWHAAMNVLYPSAASDRWRPGHAAKRDVIRDLIDALRPYGIRLMLYIHVTDGHDFTPEDQLATGWNDPSNAYGNWNNFVNAVVEELSERYGTGIDGYWLDMVFDADNFHRIDKARLRHSLLAGNPDRVIVGNGGYGDGPIASDGVVTDYASKEMFNIPQDNGSWQAAENQIATVATIKGNAPDYVWWASIPQGANALMYAPEDMYRFTVLQAAVNRNGGGMLWSAGNYAGYGALWEDGVEEGFMALGAYIAAAGESLRGSMPSTSYVRDSGATLNGLTDGIAATKSPDDRTEYIHVLFPPQGNVLVLPVPADGKRFDGGTIMGTGTPVAVSQDESGVTIVRSDADAWDRPNTIIRLTVSERP